MKRKNLIRSVVGALIGMGISLLVVLITAPGYFPVIPQIIDDFENKTYDLRFSYEHQLREREVNIDDIIIVDIDERSLDKLGRFRQWPRSYHGHLIDYLTEAGVKAIGFDILFFEHDKDPLMDDSIATATKRSGKVFHALSFEKADKETFREKMTEDPVASLSPVSAFTFEPGIRDRFITEERLEYPFAELSGASKGLGFANAHPDPDGVNRQWPLFKNLLDNTYGALALTMAMDVLGIKKEDVRVEPGRFIYLGDRVHIPIHSNVKGGVRSDGWTLINYYGDMKTFRYIPFYDVMKRRVPKQYFKDKIILVGTSATGLMDLRSTPIQGEYPGVEIHATVLQNILNNDFVVKRAGWTTFFIMVVLGIVAGTVALRFKPYWGIILTGLLLAGYGSFIYYYFSSHDIWLEFVRPGLAVLFTYMGIMAYRYLTEEREKKFIRGAFQQYLSPSVISQLTENPDMLKLGGEKKVLTAFFSDVASFSTISEKLTPEGLVQLLNEYLTDMTEIVLKYEGTLDKFEGDAIIAFFGAPVSFEDHARRACLVSLEMQERLLVLREKWSQEEHWPEIVHGMKMRIGLNTGPMVVGNMGSRMRMDYTMMGDSVNLAARLEGANKQYGTYNMISEYTFEAAKDHIEARVLDKIRVVGKSEPVEVYELLARKGDLTEEDTKLYGLYNEGIGLYRGQQWDSAISKFKEALDIRPDEPSKRYIVRCEEFKQDPPPADWDGVYTLTSK